MNKKESRIKITENPLAAGTFFNWVRLLLANDRVETKYLLRAVFVTVATLLCAPFRLIQKICYGRKIRKTMLSEDPLFIIGHYRSGTTFLQNLMTRDPQWGFVSTTQALLPGMFLLGTQVRNVFSLFLHEKRPMDNIRVSPESAEEPEHAIGNLSPYSFYHGFCFPKRMMDYYRKYVTFQGVPSKVVDSWKKTYLGILKATTFASNGKRLLIKNPTDTARIKIMLEMFPNAKFIFLYRNPYVMFPSIKNFYTAYIKDWQFHDIREETLDDNILSIYEDMMKRYQGEKSLIPENNLIEMKFETFEDNPMENLELIYRHLDLPGFQESEQAFMDYVEAQKGYQKNKYSLNQKQIEQIAGRWAMDIERWDYAAEGAVLIES